MFTPLEKVLWKLMQGDQIKSNFREQVQNTHSPYETSKSMKLGFYVVDLAESIPY